MKKLTKKDLIYLWIISLLFLGVIFLLVNTMYLYGSQLDWYSEHVSIPEYFRTLFYHTKDLFPDFAPNLGSGQNIYNLSYYGFLSPIILISYLLPNVSMTSFIIVSTLISVEIAMILFYIFLKNKNYSSETCFLSSLLFVMTSPISFHSHRHIMFINYMPFLILGLFGIDKKIEKEKSWLLALSVFLMVMTSYYFSIGGIICLIIYGIYSYLKKIKKFDLKNFAKFIFKLSIPFIVGVLSSAIITIPTLYALLAGRADSNVSISLKDLLIPSINTKNFLYYHYGLGLCAMIIPAIINFFKKKKENIFLGITLILFVTFNLFNYLLNGTMYIDAKSLIPLIPLYMLIIAAFIETLFNKKINYKIVIPFTIIIVILIILNKYQYQRCLLELVVITIFTILYYLTNKKIIFVFPIIIMATISMYFTGKIDNLELKYTTDELEEEVGTYIDNITDSDDSSYRIDNDIEITETVNKTYNNPDYYTTTIYSSAQNQTYNEFYYDIMNNNIPARNRALTVSTQNLLFLMLTGNKYVISRNEPLQGYELVEKENGINVYKNENVFPIGFATSNVMSYEDFNSLNDAIKQEALLNNIIADTQTSNNFVTNTKEIDLDFEEILDNENITVEEDGSFTIESDDIVKISYELPGEYQDKIIFLSFNMNKSDPKNDLTITINNVKNKLTASKWKYYNGNERFFYTLALADQPKLIIKFNKGTYNISDFEVYALDYAYIENASSKVDALNINQDKTKGDKLYGTINVSEDGYFMLTTAYDQGFTIKIDGEEVQTEKVDEAFIGCKITKGEHEIEVEYKAPLKNLAIIVSLCGIIAFIAINYLESKRKI